MTSKRTYTSNQGIPSSKRRGSTPCLGSTNKSIDSDTSIQQSLGGNNDVNQDDLSSNSRTIKQCDEDSPQYQDDRTTLITPLSVPVLTNSTRISKEIVEPNYDSDDCSLGSLGEVNVVNQGFFLITPDQCDNMKESQMLSFRPSSSRPIISRRRRSLTSIDSSIKKRHRIFLKPRPMLHSDGTFTSASW